MLCINLIVVFIGIIMGSWVDFDKKEVWILVVVNEWNVFNVVVCVGGVFIYFFVFGGEWVIKFKFVCDF